MRRLLLWFVLSLAVVLPQIVPISAQVFPNADAIATRAVIGRGEVKNAAWYPDGSRILISTVAGAFVYTADLEFIAHLPGTALAALSPDGRFIAGVSDEQEIVMWDAVQLTRIPLRDIASFRYISSLAGSPNGRYLAAAGDREELPFLTVWDTENDWCTTVYRLEYGGDQLLWNPSGNRLAAFTFGKGGYIWSFVEPYFTTSFPVQGLDNIRWQGDDILLIFVSDLSSNQVVTYWDAATGESVESLTLSTNDLVYSSDGRYEALIGWDGVRITDMLTGEEQTRFELSSVLLNEDSQAQQIAAVAWNSTGRLIAVGGWSPFGAVPVEVAVIDRVSQRIVQRFDDALERIRLLVWSRDNRYLLAVDQHQQVFVYDVRSGDTRAYSNAHTWVGNSLAWNDDGTRIAIADSLQNVTLWDAAHHPEALFTLDGNGGLVREIEWQTGQRYLAVQAHTGSYYDDSPVAQVWDVSQFPPVNVTDQLRYGRNVQFDGFDFTADGSHLALTSTDLLLLYDVSEIAPRLTSVQRLHFPPERIHLNPAGHGLLFISTGNYWYNQLPGQQRDFWIIPVGGFGQEAVWSDEDTVTTLTWLILLEEGWNFSATVTRWTRSSPNTPAARVGLTGSLHGLPYGYLSPNGSYAATIDTEHNGTIWDTATGSPLAWIADAGQLAWSRDETRLAVQRTDGSIWLMEPTGRILGHLPPSAAVQHPSGQLIWSPDGGRLAHLHDGIVDIWTFNPAET